MKKSRFTETQIVSILKEADAGLSVQEVCRKHGISTATNYNWKSKYGGLDASELKRIKELEAENQRLKQMFADLSLENRAMKDLIDRKLWGRARNGRRCGSWWTSTVCQSCAAIAAWVSPGRPTTAGQYPPRCATARSLRS